MGFANFKPHFLKYPPSLNAIYRGNYLIILLILFDFLMSL